MIIDIGGGTSDIAVISLSGVVESSSIKIAGDQFNEAVVKYMRRKHNLLVGERTAEQMKMQIGCVFPPEEEMTMEVKAEALSRAFPSSSPSRLRKCSRPLKSPSSASWRRSTSCLKRPRPSSWPISRTTASS